MQNKLNMTKTSVLLILAVVLAISVCLSSAYAWFYDSSTANAEISGKVLSFNFATNGQYSGSFTIDEKDITYLKDSSTTDTVNGMFPGQVMEVKLTLSNAGSNIDAIYKVALKGADTDNYPQDCSMFVSSGNNAETELGLVKDVSAVYPTASSNETAPAGKPGYAILPAGETKVITLTINWPYEYDANNGFYSDADTKNAGDHEFLNKDKPFSLTLEVLAEQMPTG